MQPFYFKPVQKITLGSRTMLKPVACLVSLALLAACQSAPAPISAQSVPSAQSAVKAEYVPIKSPVLPQVKVKPEVKLQVKGTQVSMQIKLPALSEYQRDAQTGDFKTQLLDLATAAKITATIKDSYGKTYTPVGAVAGQVDYPANGLINLTFNAVVPDKLLFVELQVRDAGADIPQADLAVVFAHTGINDITVPMGFQTTPTAKAMKALLAANAARARVINLADLTTLMTSITGFAGVDPNFTYTTHPTLVNTALLATNLATQDPSALTAADYRLAGATLGLTVSGLVGSDKIEVQSTDAASAVKLAVANGNTDLTGATPGTGLKVKVGGTASNSTQYTFVVTPNNNLTLTNGASTPITIVATPAAVSITNLAPTAGAVGSSVTITGTGFSTSAANNIVKFGSTTATVTAASATELTVTVPTGIYGAQNVTVQVGSQTSAASSYNVRPVISSLSAANAAVGSSITLTGTGFHPTMASNTVLFGSTAATVTAASATELTVTVPAVSGAQNITVQVGTQTSTAASFNITPVLNSLSVANGVVGSSVTLNGTGFNLTAANNTVSFGGTNATVTAATATSLTVTVPNTFDTRNVNVTVAGQTSGNQSFTITPNITSLSSTTGSSGDILTITGTGFHTTLGSNTVRLGAQTLTATSPGAGQLQITVPATAAGTANATVQVGTQTSATSSFAILPKIIMLTTADVVAGKAALIRGGTLTITGTNFDPVAANNNVMFGAISATTASVNAGGTSLTVFVPGTVDTPGDVAVKVVTNTRDSNSVTAMVPVVNVTVNGSGFH